MVDEEGVVRIGSVVFALIRPTPGHELAFNHWYERDHYYTTGLAAPGVFSAGRFVQPGTGWHLALYFVLPGHDDARVAFATQQVELAVEEDRMFTEREHLHTWSYVPDDAQPGGVTGTDGVPPALALDHRYSALDVTIHDSPDPVLPSSDGASLCLRPLARIMPSDWDGDIDPVTRRVVLSFHDGAASTPAPDDAVWSGRFVPMAFGTDTHVVT